LSYQQFGYLIILNGRDAAIVIYQDLPTQST